MTEVPPKANSKRNVAFIGLAFITITIFILALEEKDSQLLPASTLAYASCFILTIYFLRNTMTSIFDLVLTSLATMFSGVWLYEVFYHYYWITSLAGLPNDFSHFSIVLYPGWAFPVYFVGAIILFPFLKRQYMTLNKPLIAIVAVSVPLFTIWSALGYPQYFYASHPSAIGYWMNSATKILAVVPAFLFCKWGKIHLGRKSPQKGQAPQQVAIDNRIAANLRNKSKLSE